MATTKKTTTEPTVDELIARANEAAANEARERVRRCNEEIAASLERYGCIIGWQYTMIGGRLDGTPIIDVRQ